MHTNDERDIKEYVAAEVESMLRQERRRKRRSDLFFQLRWALLLLLIAALASIIAVRALADGGPPETVLPKPSWTAAPADESAAKAEPAPSATPELADEAEFPRLASRYEPVTAEEFELIARVVYAEANTESLEGQQAVAEVILNRRAAGNFADTVHDVVYAPGQFSTVPMLERVEPNMRNYTAVWLALYGASILPLDVVYFSRGAENGNVWGRIGAHVFCYQYVWG